VPAGAQAHHIPQFSMPPLTCLEFVKPGTAADVMHTVTQIAHLTHVFKSNGSTDSLGTQLRHVCDSAAPAAIKPTQPRIPAAAAVLYGGGGGRESSRGHIYGTTQVALHTRVEPEAQGWG